MSILLYVLNSPCCKEQTRAKNFENRSKKKKNLLLTVHPGVQMQEPSVVLQRAPFWQLQVCLQSSPWVPRAHSSSQLLTNNWKIMLLITFLSLWEAWDHTKLHTLPCLSCKRKYTQIHFYVCSSELLSQFYKQDP